MRLAAAAVVLTASVSAFAQPSSFQLQLTHIDHRAELGVGQPPSEPWQTRFNIVGAEAGSSSPATVAGEWAKGRTTIAAFGGTFALDFDGADLLVSRQYGSNRHTTRVERFSTRSHVRQPDDSAREDGRAITAAWLHDVSDHLRTSLESARATGDHPAASFAGFDPRTGGSMITAEIRYRC